MAKHEALAGRLIIGDPDDLASRNPAAPNHGTAMASLICHGNLSDPRSPPSTTLYVQPIMQPHESLKATNGRPCRETYGSPASVLRTHLRW
jgi:hypothetical protein